MRLSANVGICDDLTRVEYEAEREHWYLRQSESRPQGSAFICEHLTWGMQGNTGGNRRGTLAEGI
jgi:hypothetical protein